MADDFYPFVDSGDPAPDNSHITGVSDSALDATGAFGTTAASPFEHDAHHDGGAERGEQAERPHPTDAGAESTVYATRIAIYDDMLSTPRVIVVQPKDPRSYLEEVTNTVYRSMKEQGGALSLMVIRELVENFIHAHFTEPIVSILDNGNTIRFADQGPGINDKERAFEFGVTSANRSMKRYIRGTGAGLPMVQQYLENAGGAISIEDNLGAGTVVTVTIDPTRVVEIEANSNRGAAVRGTQFTSANRGMQSSAGYAQQQAPWPGGQRPTMPTPGMPGAYPQQGAYQPGAYPAGNMTPNMMGYPPQAPYQQPYGYPVPGGSPSYGYPMPQPGFQQFDQKFSTIQQSPFQDGEMPTGYSSPAPMGTPRGESPFLTERGLQALDFLAEHGQCGPTELTNAYGHSGPTWSRELATLSGCGFAAKHGRKYFLTELGAAWVAEHRNQG